MHTDQASQYLKSDNLLQSETFNSCRKRPNWNDDDYAENDGIDYYYVDDDDITMMPTTMTTTI